MSGKKGQGFLRVKKLLMIILILSTVYFIFRASSENATESGSLSSTVTAFINSFLVKISENLTVSEFIVRKAGHLTEFLILGVEISVYFRLLERKPWSLVVLSGLLTGLCDETIQLYVEGRFSSVTDVWIDFTGFLIGCALVYLIAKRSRKY